MVDIAELLYCCIVGVLFLGGTDVLAALVAV